MMAEQEKELSTEERKRQAQIISVINHHNNVPSLTHADFTGLFKYPHDIVESAFQIINNKNKKLDNIDIPALEQMQDKMEWEDLYNIDKFVIFEGAEKIYEIHVNGKKIRLEGKEIMDFNTFRLRYFEATGIMLPTFRGIVSFWAGLVTSWYTNKKEIAIAKSENISESEEARDLIIDYINNCSVADNYVIKEGVITFREKFVYVPTKIIKKLLKRESLTISLRKLAYVLDDYIASGSIPLKIENKSERFWKFNTELLNINQEKRLEVERIEDD